MIEAVIFDMDGVIVDTMQLHYIAWRKFWAKRGKDHTLKDFKQYFGMDNKNIFKIEFKGISDDEIEKLSNEKESYFMEAAEGKLKPTRGTVKLISKLKGDGFKIALATSAPKVLVDFVLRQIGLSDRFDAIVCSTDVKLGKPNPEIFLKAAEKIGAKPSYCAVIEDSVHGLEAAEKAGMKRIAVTTTRKASELAADLIVDSLGALSVESFRDLK